MRCVDIYTLMTESLERGWVLLHAGLGCLRVVE
jgi:hypothetical protein